MSNEPATGAAKHDQEDKKEINNDHIGLIGSVVEQQQQSFLTKEVNRDDSNSGSDHVTGKNESSSDDSSSEGQQQNAAVSGIETLSEEVESVSEFCFPTLEEAKEQAEKFAKKVSRTIWQGAHFHSLPEWLQDNEFLIAGHRPHLPSFSACLMSVFRIHSETGNIWSHALGCLLFLAITAYIYTRPHHEVHLERKFVFLPFLSGAIICLALSSAFHTMVCHSERINRLFLKLDYVGISLLITGSFIPWLYYSFYCRVEPKIVYISLITFLGLACVWVSFCEAFSLPHYRPVRAGVFLSFGFSGIIPVIHFFLTEGVSTAFKEAAFGWLLLMGFTYLAGALLYAFRIPERFFPGKCDIWFQSHQLFHLLVVIAAFINYHGISELSASRLSGQTCEELEKLKCSDASSMSTSDNLLNRASSFLRDL